MNLLLKFGSWLCTHGRTHNLLLWVRYTDFFCLGGLSENRCRIFFFYLDASPKVKSKGKKWTKKKNIQNNSLKLFLYKLPIFKPKFLWYDVDIDISFVWGPLVEFEAEHFSHWDSSPIIKSNGENWTKAENTQNYSLKWFLFK